MRTVTNPFYCMKGVEYDETKYCDLEGNIVENNPMEYPYSYDPYVIYKSSDYKPTDVPFHCWEVMYSIKEEVDKALNQMGLKRFGPSWEHLSWEVPQQVERFMGILMKQNITCTAIVKCCYGDGNPYWIVYLH